MAVTRKRLSLRILIMLSVLIGSAVTAGSSLAESKQTAKDQYGNTQGWTAEPGAVTVIDFAASWCGPCRQTLPKLQSFAGSHPELRVLVISVDDTKDGRDNLVKDLGLTLPVLWDEGHRAAKHYRPQGMPATFVFDASGRQVFSYSGSKPRDWQKLVQTIEGLSP